VHKYSQEQNVIGSSAYILHPKHPFQGIWDLSISFLLGLTIITIPLQLAFEEFHESAGMLELGIAIDFVFLLDVVKNLNSGFINEDDIVVMQRRIITRAYLLSWFVPDVLSSIPIELFIQVQQSDGGGGGSAHYARTSKTMKLMRMLKLMKVFRLMRVNRVFKYMRLASQWMSDRIGFTSSASNQGVIRIGKLFGMLLLLAHWIGCLNYMLCRIWDFPEESWVVQYNIAPGAATMGKQYTWSFFKAMQLMISSGMDSWGG
jgi:hypothetical protein